MKTHTIKLSDLKSDPKNARKHNPRNIGMIADSLAEVGAGRSGVIDEDEVILVGNGTAEALAERGIEKVRVIETDGNEWVVVQRTGLTEEQKRKLALADNRASDLATWDGEMLRAQGIDLQPFFSDEELLPYGQQTPDRDESGVGQDPEPQIDKAAELQEKYGTKLGQIWQLGEHRIVCGDCTDERLLNKLFDGIKPALLLTDPPYGISVVQGLRATDGGSKEVTIGSLRARRKYPFGGVKNMGVAGTDGASHMVDARLYRPVIGDDKPFDPSFLAGLADHMILFGGNYFASKLADSRCWIVWDKNNTGNFADAELAWTDFDKGVKLYQFTWNGLVREGERAIEGIHRVHPTQKPVGLFERILEDFSSLGEYICDTYLGSGTTLLACERRGRICFATELDPAYIACGLERWATLTGKEPKLIEG